MFFLQSLFSESSNSLLFQMSVFLQNTYILNVLKDVSFYGGNPAGKGFFLLSGNTDVCFHPGTRTCLIKGGHISVLHFEKRPLFTYF